MIMHFLGLEDADERDIRTVYSHKQSLMQCSEFLDSHADWEKFSVSNNAVAAKKVKEDGEISQAAIASAKKCPDLWVESITQFHSE